MAHSPPEAAGPTQPKRGGREARKAYLPRITQGMAGWGGRGRLWEAEEKAILSPPPANVSVRPLALWLLCMSIPWGRGRTFSAHQRHPLPPLPSLANPSLCLWARFGHSLMTLFPPFARNGILSLAALPLPQWPASPPLLLLPLPGAQSPHPDAQFQPDRRPSSQNPPFPPSPGDCFRPSAPEPSPSPPPPKG